MRMSALKGLVKKMPALFTACQHLQRRMVIIKMRRRKKISWEKKLNLVEKTYFSRVGHSLHWDKVTTYSEKMQWAKMYEADPRKTLLADKYAVRAWVADKIGDEYLIPLVGAWNKFSEIDFSALPNQFVLKTNNGSGTNLIVKDKSKLNIRQVDRLFQDWLDIDFAYYNPFEFQYASIPPKIIAEKYMDAGGRDLPDFKFLCFNGKPEFCWVDMDRHSTHKRNVYNMDWILQSWNQLDYGNYENSIPCPVCFDEMKRIAAALADGFSHVRVDLYEIDGKVYFGEMTFSNGSGFEKIVPDDADLMLGNLWKIDTSRPKKWL